MHLPEPLYRALPYSYVIAGVVIALLFNQPIAIFGAVLLVMAGLQIFDMRITKRVRRNELGHFRRCEMAHTCEKRAQ